MAIFLDSAPCLANTCFILASTVAWLAPGCRTTKVLRKTLSQDSGAVSSARETWIGSRMLNLIEELRGQFLATPVTVYGMKTPACRISMVRPVTSVLPNWLRAMSSEMTMELGFLRTVEGLPLRRGKVKTWKKLLST